MKGRDVEPPLYESTKGVLVSLRGGLRLEGVCEEQHRAGGGGRERKLPMTTPSQLKYIVHIWLSVLEQFPLRKRQVKLEICPVGLL